MNLTINSEVDYQGLFGYNKGTIKNVGIETGEIKAKAFVGAIAGMSEGLIENCYNKATIDCTEGDWIGGIAGRIKKGAKVSMCYNTGAINATTSVNFGKICGIVGYCDLGSTIECCYNTGNLTLETNVENPRVAGISDGSGKIDSCYNTGTMKLKVGEKSTSESNVIAGIGAQCENGGCICNCYNIGALVFEGPNTNVFIRKAAIVGYVGKNSEITNNYYFSKETVKGWGDKNSNVDEKTLDIHCCTTDDKLENKWQDLGNNFKKDEENINNGYPILKWQ